MAGKEIGVGLIGCGTMGSRLTRAIEELDVGRVVAIWDTMKEPMDTFVDNLRPRGEKIADEFQGRACSSLDDMLDDAEVEAIMVATPDFCHEEPVVAAARAGKHVFVEKPMALDTAACDRMIEAARTAGVTLMVGQSMRYREPFCRALRCARDGRFGRPFHFQIRDFIQRPVHEGFWFNTLAGCGGYLYGEVVHEFDFMRCLFGEPESIYCVRQKVRQAAYEVEDTVSLLIRFESGASCCFDGGRAWGEKTYSRTVKKKQEFTLLFEEATLHCPAFYAPETLTAVSADGEREIALEDPEKGRQFDKELGDWLECLRDGRPVPIPGEDGRAAVRMAELAYRSAETGELQEF